MAWRWALVCLIAAVALAVALWPRGSDGGAAREPIPTESAVSDELRRAAGLAPCPRATPEAAVAGPLAGITVTCLADGAPVDLAAALAGKPALVNLWAYWCGPCAEELPYLQEFADRAGDAITVLTVHSDGGATQALSRLESLGVTLPGVLDPDERVRIAIDGAPILPMSVLVRADGTIAPVRGPDGEATPMVRRAFTSVDDIANTVAQHLGVTV